MRKPSLSTEELLLTDRPALEALPPLAGPLLAWYDRAQRILPWRENPTPYRVWISEIMLQQTRVEAVRGYFTRFLAALPTVQDLAAVDDDALLKLWEGLGYYSRARNLKRAAQAMMERHGGTLPASYAALLDLPGIGEYTAGAIASIAFGIPVPAVDGNVYRVISRLLGSYADISLPAVKAAFRDAVIPMLPQERPGDFNQALMELGATVCLPNAAPQCLSCPVAGSCAGCAGGFALELPVKAQKKPRRVEERTILLVVAGGRLLLLRRGDRGLLAGMYEPLNLEGTLPEEASLAAVRALGGSPQRAIPLAPAKHLFPHVEWRMSGYLIHCPPFETPGGVLADGDSLAGEYALPSAFRPFLSQINNSEYN